MVERKNVNITWHYRNSDPDYGSWMSRELLAHLRDTISAKFPVDVLVGKKAIEVRPKGVSKGTALKRILTTDAANDPYDFIMCLGDDKTDEGRSHPLLFLFMNETLLTIHCYYSRYV